MSYVNSITEISRAKIVLAEPRRPMQENLKDALRSLIDQGVLDPETLDLRIHYRIGLDGRNRVASPRVRDSIPVLRGISTLRLPSR